MVYSTEGIPNNLLQILQNAENFEVWFFNSKLSEDSYNFKSEYIDFQPDQVNRNVGSELKKALISSFLEDTEKSGEADRCWIPQHGISAIYNNQLVEIAVCFICGWYRGQIHDEKFYGTFPNEDKSQSSVIFDKIIAEIK